MIDAERAREALVYDPATGVFRWRKSSRGTRAGDIAGADHGNGYIMIRVDKCRIFAHRLAWLYVHGDWPAEQIDHINGDRADNRISNLREATCSQNLANQRRRSDNSSGFKGVSFNKRKNRWRAYIRPDNRQRHLGYFLSREAAHEAYVKAAVTHFGEFAYGGAS